MLVDIFCGDERVDWKNPFPQEYDVDAASAYMSSFNTEIENMKKARRNFFGPNVLTLCEQADVVFLGLHGANGEDGKVQAAFDLMGIKYTGTGYLSSALAMDKGIIKQMFLMHDVPTQEAFHEEGSCCQGCERIGMEFPVVVKTCCGGSSVGVYIAADQAEYEKALEDAYSYEDEVVIEEYIKGENFLSQLWTARHILLSKSLRYRASMITKINTSRALQLKHVLQSFLWNSPKKCRDMQRQEARAFLVWKATAVLIL